jgi:hypothetical protein
MDRGLFTWQFSVSFCSLVLHCSTKRVVVHVKFLVLVYYFVIHTYSIFKNYFHTAPLPSQEDADPLRIE